MTADTLHPCFQQPNEIEATVWRYMSVSKFLNFALSQHLHFSLLSSFRDKFEGVIPQHTKAERHQTFSQLLFKLKGDPSSLFNYLDTSAEKTRRNTFVNCWHLSEFESAAMWDLYGERGSTVAIRTTYRKLIESMPPCVHAGLIRYVDISKHVINESNGFEIVMHKRASFSHEQEIRLVLSDMAEKRNFDGVIFNEYGAKVPFDASSNLDAIHVSPDAPSWLIGTIEETCRLVGITTQLFQSTLYEPALK